jgi:hypothetical protein
MDEFLRALLEPPTVIFTGLMAIVLLFWVIASLGAIDVDFLDFDVDLDTDVDADVDVDGGGGGLLETLGFAGLPVSIAGTAVVLFAWIGSYVLNEWVGPNLEETLSAGASRIAVFVAASILSMIAASLALRPVRNALGNYKAVSKHALLGRFCRVTSLRVSADQGQGEIEDGGAGIVAQVRCVHFNQLQLHSRAIVVGYDADEDAFTVEPADEPSA